MRQLTPDPIVAGHSVAGRLVMDAPGETASPWWPAGSRSTLVLGVLVLTAGLTAISLALASSTSHLEYPGANALVRPYLIASPMLIGLFWRLRRPESQFGNLLILYGIAFFPLSWQASNDPLLHTIGVVLGDTLGLTATFYLALVFPVGRMLGRADAATMAALVGAMVALAIGALSRPAVQGGGPLSRCGDACPPNPIQITVTAPTMEFLGTIETIGVLGATAAAIVIIAARIVRASKPRRRAFLAVALTSLAFFPIFFVYQLIRRTAGADAPILDPLGWVNIAARLAFALGFLVVLVRAELFAASALRQLLDRLTQRPAPREWQRVVAGALDDPGLRLGFWDPIRREYRQVDGIELRDDATADRAWITVGRDGSPVAALDIDGGLESEPELVRAVADATLLAVEYGALEGELRTSRREAVAAGDVARRRIAQDLHDSAQQRLIALRMHLQTARAHTPRQEERTALAEMQTHVDDALGDIRAVSRGTHTDELRRAGIVAALDSMIATGAVAATLRAASIGRHPNEIEDAVYFTILEALQNVSKHAGPGASAEVRIDLVDGAITFAVEDDGIGFDPRIAQGLGLASMTARIASVGGWIRAESAVGAGTRIVGTVPVEDAGATDGVADGHGRAAASE